MTNIDTIRNKLAYQLYAVSTSNPEPFTQEWVTNNSDYIKDAKIILLNLIEDNILVCRLHDPIDLTIKGTDTSRILYRLLETNQGTLADQRTYFPSEPNDKERQLDLQLDSLLSRLQELLI